MTKATSKIVAAVCGADTRIGNRLAKKLPEQHIGVLPRPMSWAMDSSVKTIQEYLSTKSPTVVYNCLMDPDGGDEPYSALSYAAATLGMLNYCRKHGARYVHVSSSRVYGPTDRPETGNTYSEYDSVLLGGDDPWRRLIAAAERHVMSQTMFANPYAISHMSPHFGFYVARFGHVISFDELNCDRYSEVMPLACCLKLASQQNIELTCDAPDALLSPVSVEFAADCLVDLAKPACMAPYGFYNIGSSDQVTLRQLCLLIARHFGYFTTFTSPGKPGRDKAVYGLDANQAVCSDWWVGRGMRKVPSWKAAIKPLLSAPVYA
jgi:dTDP-4-dehydrorhamnose reductase